MCLWLCAESIRISYHVNIAKQSKAKLKAIFRCICHAFEWIRVSFAWFHKVSEVQCKRGLTLLKNMLTIVLYTRTWVLCSATGQEIVCGVQNRINIKIARNYSAIEANPSKSIHTFQHRFSVGAFSSLCLFPSVFKVV